MAFLSPLSPLSSEWLFAILKTSKPIFTISSPSSVGELKQGYVLGAFSGSIIVS